MRGRCRGGGAGAAGSGWRCPGRGREGGRREGGREAGASGGGWGRRGGGSDTHRPYWSSWCCRLQGGLPAAFSASPAGPGLWEPQYGSRSAGWELPPSCLQFQPLLRGEGSPFCFGFFFLFSFFFFCVWDFLRFFFNRINRNLFKKKSYVAGLFSLGRGQG